MAQITLNIPDNQITKIVNSFADYYGWTNESGLTKAQFAKLKLIDYIKDIVRQSALPERQRNLYATLQGEIDAISID